MSAAPVRWVEQFGGGGDGGEAGSCAVDDCADGLGGGLNHDDRAVRVSAPSSPRWVTAECLSRRVSPVGQPSR